MVRGWHEHCIAAEVTGSRQSILSLRIQLCTANPTVPFKLCIIRFPIKIALPWQPIRLKGRHLNVMGYNHSRLLFPWPALCSIFPTPFIWKRRCCIYWMASTEYRKWYIYNIKYYTELSKKMDGIWNRYNLKSTGRIYTFGVLKCSEKFKVLDLP